MINTQSKNIYLGIDPGLADTGYGLIDYSQNRLKLIDCGSIKTDKNQPTAKRLEQIEKKLIKIINQHQPQSAGIEKLFFGRNTTTAMTVGQARGVIILTLSKNNIPTSELTPSQVKQAVTGYGSADKKQVQQMVKTILGLKKIPQPDDAADALAIAISLSGLDKWKNALDKA